MAVQTEEDSKRNGEQIKDEKKNGKIEENKEINSSKKEEKIENENEEKEEDDESLKDDLEDDKEEDIANSFAANIGKKSFLGHTCTVKTLIDDNVLIPEDNALNFEFMVCYLLRF